MKKSIFKKLSIVLSLALVFTSVSFPVSADVIGEAEKFAIEQVADEEVTEEIVEEESADQGSEETKETGIEESIETGQEESNAKVEETEAEESTDLEDKTEDEAEAEDDSEDKEAEEIKAEETGAADEVVEEDTEKPVDIPEMIVLTAEAEDGIIVTMKAEISAFVDITSASPTDASACEDNTLASQTDASAFEDITPASQADAEEDDDGVTLISAEDYDPELMELHVTVIEETDTENNKAVEDDLEDKTKDDNIAKRVTYDIYVTYAGEKIEPLPGKKVEVSFAIPEVPTGADEISVYHHTEEGAETIIDEKLSDLSENEEESSEAEEVITDDIVVKGETTGFSLYTIDFTYNEKTLQVPGGTLHNDLAVILADLGITDEIIDVKACNDEACDNPADGNLVKDGDTELYKVYEEGGKWYLDSLNAFSTTHGLFVKTDKAEYKIKVTDASDNYLTFTAEEAGSTIKLDWDKADYVEYKTVISKVTSVWTSYTKGTVINLKKGDNVSFRGKGVTTYSAAHFVMEGKIAASGDVTSLMNGVGGNATLKDYCCDYMFDGCTALTSAPNLPATTLVNSCYRYMFQGCTNLTTAPSLPATTLAPSCYSNMFKGCIKLTTAPSLPATTLAPACYAGMFYCCISLSEAPELKVTTLKPACYSQMFYGCWNLSKTPELSATTLVPACYAGMFRGCINLTKAPELKATTLAEYCYANMFRGCINITTAPELKVKSLKASCYEGMFYNCINLTTAPLLPAESLVTSCYKDMFYGCTSLRVTEEDTSEHSLINKIFNCPSSIGENSVTGMFTNTGGSCTDNPKTGKVYYYYTVDLDKSAQTATPGTVTKIYVTKDTPMPNLTGSTMPTRAGYVFEGYFDAQSGGKQYYNASGANVVSNWDKTEANATLYAQWRAPATYSITYHLDGGTVSPANPTSYIETETFTLNNPTKTGYTFKGWTGSCGGTASTSVAIPGGTPENKVYTANWTVNQYTITFDSDDGSTVSPITQDYETAIIAPATPTKAGYTFSDWDPELPEKMPAYNMTLTALWATNSNTAYTVKHYQQNVAGDGYTLIATDSEAGMTGDQTAATTKSYAGFTAQSFNQVTISGDGNAKVEIYYNRNTYTATFESNGQTYDTQQAKYGALIDKPSTPTNSGYNFGGWYKEAACTTVWDFSTDTMPANDMPLYAQWTAKPTITVTAKSTSKVYDGTALTYNDYTYTGNLVGEDTLEVTFDQYGITFVGSMPNKVTSVKVKRGGEDVTGEYSIATPVNGTLTITPTNAYIITADSASKAYDGTPLTASGYTISGTLCNGDKLESVETVGSITDVGSVENKVKATIKRISSGQDITNCYTLVNGTLTVYSNNSGGNTTKSSSKTVTRSKTETKPTSTNTGTGSWSAPATGTWTKDATGNWVFGNQGIARFTNSWGYIQHSGPGADWYYFGADGKMATGFQTINGQTYYFQETKDNREGAMATGFQTINGKIYYFEEKKDSTGGAMAAGWKKINGKNYYFGTDGVLLTNGTTPDGKKVGADGSEIIG